MGKRPPLNTGIGIRVEVPQGGGGTLGGAGQVMARAVATQLQRFRTDFPECFLAVVVTNHGDNSFDLRRPGLPGLMRHIKAINPSAYQYLFEGQTVLVRHYDVNRQRAYIKGIGAAGDLSEDSDEVLGWPRASRNQSCNRSQTEETGGEILADLTSSIHGSSPLRVHEAEGYWLQLLVDNWQLARGATAALADRQVFPLSEEFDSTMRPVQLEIHKVDGEIQVGSMWVGPNDGLEWERLSDFGGGGV